MIKSILVPMDNSDTSITALNLSIEIAKSTKARIKGLYVEDIYRLTQEMLPHLGTSHTASVSVLRELENTNVEAECIKEGNRVEQIFEEERGKSHFEGNFARARGLTVESIADTAKSTDLIVMGKRGREFEESKSNEPGPITENIIRKTVKPVIVVPANARLNTKILIAYDSSETAQRAISIGAMFATFIPSEVNVITVSENPETAEKSLLEAREFLSSYELKTSFKQKTGSHEHCNAILKEAESIQAGLIVLGACSSYKILEKIFGSTTRMVLTKSTCPVMICR